MKHLLIIFILLISNISKSEEVLNLHLLCKGDLSSWQKGTKAKKNEFTQSIIIKNNYWKNMPLTVKEDEIFNTYTKEEKKNEQNIYGLSSMFSIKRYTGEIFYILTPKFTNTKYFLHFNNAKCEKKSKEDRKF